MQCRINVVDCKYGGGASIAWQALSTKRVLEQQEQAVGGPPAGKQRQLRGTTGSSLCNIPLSLHLARATSMRLGNEGGC